MLKIICICELPFPFLIIDHNWNCAVNWNSKHLVADLLRQHHACKTLTRNCIWLLRIIKTWDNYHLHYCFTSPTKEDRVPKLVSASLRIHGSRGGFLLPSVTAPYQPFVRVYRFPTVTPPVPGKTSGTSLADQPTSSFS